MDLQNVTILSVISVIVQIYCAVHAFRRKQWIWAILSLIFIFSAVFYLILYVIPELRGGGGRGRVSGNFTKKIVPQESTKDIFKTLNPEKELERLLKLVEESDTVENKRNVADQYMRMGKYKEAYEFYKSCLNGIFKDDAYLLLDAAKASFGAEMYNESLNHIKVIKETTNEFTNKSYILLEAKNLLALDKKDEAFKTLVNTYHEINGEEAKLIYAKLLCEREEVEKGLSLAKEIVDYIQIATPLYKREQGIWANEAKKLLNDYQNSSTSKLN